MRFLCLISADKEYMMEFMKEEDMRNHFQEYKEFTDQIKSEDAFISANRLQPPESAVTVRIRNGEKMIMDGPFAETKEQIGGYYIIEAENMDRAVDIAAKIPGARFGSVEVRPLADDAETKELGFDEA